MAHTSVLEFRRKLSIKCTGNFTKVSRALDNSSFRQCGGENEKRVDGPVFTANHLALSLTNNGQMVAGLSPGEKKHQFVNQGISHLIGSTRQ